jgi:hypothetical protein
MRSFRGLWLVLLGLWLSAAPVGAELADVRIAEVKPGASGEQWAELLNGGPEPVSLDGVWLASDNWVAPLKGLETLPAGGTALIHWNASGTTKGRDFFTGPTFPWNPARGNLGLHRSDQLGLAAEMIAYVQWGQGAQMRSDIAEAAGLWSPQAFLPPVPDEDSFALAPGGLGHAPRDWADGTPPTPGTPNAGVVSAWRGWNMLAGRTSLEPALSYDVDHDTLDLAAIDTNGAPIQYHFEAGAWAAGVPLGLTTKLPAALATSSGGTVELVVVGADQVVYHNRLSGRSWSGFTPLGQRTALPPALAYNVWARAVELVIVGLDGQLLHNRFSGGQWGTWTRVGGSSGTPPGLGVSSQNSSFDVLFATAQDAIFRGRFALGGWGTPDAVTGQSTRLRPAVAAGVAGNLEVVITGTDGMLYHNRYLAGRWRTWTGLQKTSDLPPSLISNLNTNTLELVVVGRDRQVAHTRFINGRWSNWLPLGALAATAPALVQSADDDLELVVAGEDRSLWHARFRPHSTNLVSYQKEILPIFINQCAVCHESDDAPMDLHLDVDHGYDETVNTPAQELRTMPRISPLSPEQSYLYHKINDTHREVGGEGSRMPQGSRLPQAEIDKIRAWILQGALNN